ncbi:hypothetical protein [Amycolatopsis anabasis]|uniref:hypothetical protein n=1 Tax=Amycolatopsis anabasis TaxID=1840409 RepID=UPI001FE87C03|nr:hypothetical protein [Amycolatopsis anabasis]
MVTPPPPAGAGIGADWLGDGAELGELALSAPPQAASETAAAATAPIPRMRRMFTDDHSIRGGFPFPTGNSAQRPHRIACPRHNADVDGERCEICDMLIGLGCPGHDRARTRTLAVERILISPHKLAHLPDRCNHHPETSHEDAGWGWITGPAPGLWEQIGPEHPVRATAGNTELWADNRCRDCLT